MKVQSNNYAKKKKLPENLDVGEKVLVLAKRIKKKSAPGKFYKQSVQNNFYFNKKTVLTIRNKQKIDRKTYFWSQKKKKIHPKKNCSEKTFMSENVFFKSKTT